METAERVWNEVSGLAAPHRGALRLRNSFDAYALVLGNIDSDQVLGSTALAKAVVTVFSAFGMDALNERRPFIPRIYLYGPYPSGNTTTLTRMGLRGYIDRDLFATRDLVRTTGGGTGERFEDICGTLRERFPETMQAVRASVRAIVTHSDDLESLIQIAYSAALRRDAILDQSISLGETGADVVLASIAHNVRQLERARMLDDSSAVELPTGSMRVAAANLWANSDRVCLKEGTRNKLLALLAIGVLRQRGARTGAGLEYLLGVLSSRYNRVATRAKTERDPATATQYRRERDEYYASYYPDLKEIVEELRQADMVKKLNSSFVPTVSKITYDETEFDLVAAVGRTRAFHERHVKAEK